MLFALIAAPCVVAIGTQTVAPKDGNMFSQDLECVDGVCPMSVDSFMQHKAAAELHRGLAGYTEPSKVQGVVDAAVPLKELQATQLGDDMPAADASSLAARAVVAEDVRQRVQPQLHALESALVAELWAQLGQGTRRARGGELLEVIVLARGHRGPAHAPTREAGAPPPGSGWARSPGTAATAATCPARGRLQAASAPDGECSI